MNVNVYKQSKLKVGDSVQKSSRRYFGPSRLPFLLGAISGLDVMVVYIVYIGDVVDSCRLS